MKTRTILTLIIIQLLVSCSGDKKTNTDINVSINQYTPSINILTLAQPQNEHMEAQISGELRIDSLGCIYIEGHIIIWPYDYQLNKNKNAICNANGKVVVEIGSLVELSGGERSSFSKSEFEKRIISSSPNVCKGKYWIVGEEIKVL